MAFAERSHFARTDRQEATRAGQLMAGGGILLAALITTFGLRQLVPAEAVAPALVTLLFAASAGAAGLAILFRSDRLRVLWFDLAGGLTFVGIVISVFIEPDQLAGLIGASNEPK